MIPDSQFGRSRLWCWYIGERVRDDCEEDFVVGRVEEEGEGIKEEEEAGQDEGDV